MEDLQNNMQLYLENSKSNIDSYIQKQNYKKAFFLLVLLLERLNEDEKNEIIDYYMHKFYELM